MKPLFIDFSDKALQARRKKISKRSELIIRAIGKNKTVIDATAGFGVDSFILASYGYQVLMLERAPEVAKILKQGLENYLQIEPTLPLTFKQANAIVYLENLTPEQYPDVIYLDPIYPERKKSALGKGKLRALKEIVGEDTDAKALFDIALKCATNRVVVKRPRLTDCLGDQPDLCFTGKGVRFDCYLKLATKSTKTF